MQPPVMIRRTRWSFQTGNVGIGTNNPQTKLHIYQDTINETKLIIQNNFTSSGAITSSPSATTTGTTGNYTYQIFTYTTETAGAGSGQSLYSINVPTGGIVCDILIIGGGGGGGFDGAGGGGGGEVKYYTDITTPFKTGASYTLPAGTNTINVGRGGTGGVSVGGVGTNGIRSQIKNNAGTTLLSAGGGGAGGSKNSNGISGVGGGGGAGHGGSFTGGSSTGSGGIGGNSGASFTGGGGGGGANVANKNGGNGQTTIAGTGGVGVNIDITGTSVGYGGGGGGGTYLLATQIIGTHGGGNGGTENTFPSSGTISTGGGGGGGGANFSTSSAIGGGGGSGVVIIRYLSPSTSSSLELVRGTTTDGVLDYSVGNYDSDFKIKSVNAGTPTDRMIINSSGNVGIGGSVGIGTTALTRLHIYNATASTIRLETGTSGKSSIEFAVATLTDAITDYRIINDAYELKFQYQDNLVSYGGVGSDIMLINDKGADFKKKAYFDGVVGIKTPPDPLYSLDVSGDVRYLSGNVGIGTEPSTGAYRLNVAGDVNIDGIGNKYYINNSPIVSSQWNTSGTTIEYNTGSVGIGTSALSYKLNVNGSINATSILVNGATLDYNALNNKPITLIPTTTNLQLATGYNFLVDKSIISTNTTTGTNDILNMRYDTRNGIRFTQTYIGTDDVKYDLIQKVANVDKTASLTFSNGNVGIGTTNATRSFQVGFSRLVIAKDTTESTTIGTYDDPTGGFLNTRIILRGYDRTDTAYGGTGNILYIATKGGKHLFLSYNSTNTTEIEQMRIDTGNGNVAIGTTDASTYRLNVNGTLNATSILVGGNPVSGSKWTTATDTTRIYYNTGNVGIGTNNPQRNLQVQSSIRIGGAGAIIEFGDDNNTCIYKDNTISNMIFQTGGNERMRIRSNGYVGIGTNNPANILQVGGGGRLRISNSTTDYTLIGTDDVDGTTNTRIVMGSSANPDDPNSIYYIAAGTGRHDWETGNRSLRMRLANNGQLTAYVGISTPGIQTNSINGNYSTSGPLVIDPNYSTNSYVLMWDDVRVQGNFSVSSGTKSWRIKHPILEDMDLIHACIEAPRADNLYRGRKQLINGECEVNIDLECNTTGGMTDGTFELINKNIQVFVNNNETFDRVIGKVVGNKLNIKCENINADCFIDWLVIGERNDDDMKGRYSSTEGSIIVEIERGEQPIRPPRTTCNDEEPIPSNVNYEPSPLNVNDEEPTQPNVNYDEPIPSNVNYDEPIPSNVNYDEPIPLNVNDEEPIPSNVNDDEPIPLNVNDEPSEPVGV
jgi:hypothetical protein